MEDQDYSSGPETNEPAPDQNANSDTPDATDSGSFFLSPDLLGGKECKAGDLVKLKILGSDKDGNYEVELADDAEPDSDQDDTDASMAEQMRSEISQGGAGSALRSARQTNAPVRGI
jgi:hypothetical protein